MPHSSSSSRNKRLFTLVAPCAMTVFLGRTLLLGFRGCGTVGATCWGSSTNGIRAQRLAQFRGGGQSENTKKIYRTLQVQVVHRHGDRSPITPLKDEDYWAKTLIPPELLDKISSNTNVITTPGEENTHAAHGRGPFGKLTQLGLFQLVELGNKLREELVAPVTENEEDDEDHHLIPDPLNPQHHKIYPYPWHSQRPLQPSNIKIVSTNFPRTIQSVQGLLVGLFPDGTPGETIDIDARHTEILIPDPQPRRTPEQIQLEAQLAKLPHLKQRDLELQPVAVRMTAALRDSLGEGAFGVSFGVGEEKDEGNNNNNQQPVLAYTQLAEITKCLEVRNRLPPTITKQDKDKIATHTAWRWFEALRHPRLIYLAMNPMVQRMVDAMHRHETEPPVIVYSAHDSTLIGLLCGFRLEPPTVWPEYGSYLKLELLQVTCLQTQSKSHVVRFSLNGNVLKSVWEDDKEEPMVEIPLELLTHKIKTVGAVA
ncbi:Pfam:Acid_phosphat_A [Seminavis robusta]|uniref:Pfam:Acid_phosphat_A n=1 Tax=Seminavis robusta TaxID=568900 RepID=A0A9N8HLJ6_9STRA|nr:Pfam:Acid_phosphat_A [Seminavis robusta]|eukprot:Sro688_g187400.1 Pfam:Acid_phosphat_A (482) ;mRNA; f:32348-33793